MDIAQLGIQVNSAAAVKATTDLDRLAVSAGKADAAADRLAANAGRVGPAMAGAGQNSRMFAMQLSQVAQQASATGNFVQALAIQLPDMAMGFGAAGIAAGVLASVALPALAAAFMNGGTEAQRLQDIMAEMDDAVSAFGSAVEAANVPTEELIEKYGRLADVAQRALDAMADVERVEAINAVNAAIAEALGQITEIGRINARDAGQLFLIDDFGLAADAADRLTQAIRDLDNAQGLEAQAVAADRVRQAMLQAYGSVEAMPAPMQRVYQAMAQAAEGAAEVNKNTSELPGLFSSAAQAADAVTGAVNGIAGAAAGAAEAVAGLATRLWEAAQARAEAALDVQNDTGGMAAQYRMYGQGRASGERLARESGSLFGGGSVLPGARGGGGGAADQYAADLEALVTSLETERETLDAWYAENQAILADRRAEEILGTQAHKEAMLALEEEYQRRVQEVEATAQQQRISDSASFFGSLASIASAGGQKTAKAVAAFQAIEGTINAYGAAIKALNTPGITLAGRFAAYASVLAAGLRGVAAIRSAGGVAGGGGVGGSGSIAAQGTQQAQQQTAVFMVKGLDRDALYSGEMLAKIFDGITEEAQKRGLQVGLRFI